MRTAPRGQRPQQWKVEDCERVFSVNDEPNNSEKMKGLLATSNLLAVS